MNLTFGSLGFHCSTFPEKNNGVIMITEDLSFFIYCTAGSNDNTYNGLEIKLRHFDRSYNGDIAYITSNDAQRIHLYGHNEHGQDQSIGFYFHLDDKVTSEWRGFKMRAVPDHNYSFSGHYINDTTVSAPIRRHS